MKTIFIHQSVIRIVKGDITDQTTDAIVNAANNRLAPGGGVAGAIHRAAGPMLWEECRQLGGCATGQAKITKGYDLNAKFVIHTVGPIYSGSKSDALQLSSCYKNCLNLLMDHGLTSISFPAISTGIFGYPLDEAATIALRTVKTWLNQAKTPIVVQFVLFSDQTLQAFEHADLLQG